MRTRAVWFVVALVLGTRVAFAAPPAEPLPKAQVEEAQGHFFKGVELYNDADFGNAVVEFKRAYELAPDFHVLFNVGQACYQAQSYACALQSFQKYLTDGGTQIPAKRRADVEKDIKKLVARVASLEISVSVAGAVVTVDDEKVGEAPIGQPVMVSQGKRKITATKAGYEPLTQTVELAGGDAQKIDLVLKEIPKPVIAPPPEPPRVVRKSPLPWIGVGVTGALTVGAVITGIIALDASDKAGNRLRALGSSPVDIKNQQSQAASFALVTDILGVTAIAAAATTAVLFIVLNKAPKDEAPKQAWIRPFVAPSGAGVAGAF